MRRMTGFLDLIFNMAEETTNLVERTQDASPDSVVRSLRSVALKKHHPVTQVIVRENSEQSSGPHDGNDAPPCDVGETLQDWLVGSDGPDL